MYYYLQSLRHHRHRLCWQYQHPRLEQDLNFQCRHPQNHLKQL